MAKQSRRKRYTAAERKAYAMGFGAECERLGIAPYIGAENVASFRAGKQAVRDKKTLIRRK